MLHLSHKILKFIFLSIFLTSYNNSYSKDRDMKSNANISINDSMYISKTDLEKLKIDASSGNSQAASKLANYFAFYEFNNDKFIFWLIRSAELGNTQAQYDLAYIFFDHYQDSKRQKQIRRSGKMGSTCSKKWDVYY